MIGRLTHTTKKKIAAEQAWKCRVCDNLLDECFEIDHILAKRLGGGNSRDNLQALCPNCHRKKTNRDMGLIASKRKEDKMESTVAMESSVMPPYTPSPATEPCPVCFESNCDSHLCRKIVSQAARVHHIF